MGHRLGDRRGGGGDRPPPPRHPHRQRQPRAVALSAAAAAAASPPPAAPQASTSRMPTHLQLISLGIVERLACQLGEERLLRASTGVVAKLEAQVAASGGGGPGLKFIRILIRDLSAWGAEESGIAQDPTSLSAKLTAPITLLMALTMCSVDRRGGKDDPRFVGPVRLTVVSVVSPVFILFATKLLPRVTSSPPVTVALLAWWIFVVWWIWMARRIPKRGMDVRASTALQILAFVQGIAWMHLCADEIVGRGGQAVRSCTQALYLLDLRLKLRYKMWRALCLYLVAILDKII